MYNRIDDNDIKYLSGFIPPGRITVGAAISADYSHDEMTGARRMPDVLIEPVTTDEVSKVLAYANALSIPVTPRGAGSGLVGACVPVHGGIVVCLHKMNRIIELDETNMTITVEPGVLLKEVAARAESAGLFYPPDPGEKTATIGGNIATNAGGMRAVRYGVTRDFVRGLEIVLADGTVIDLGGKVVKNSSGYSLKDLIVGSEGTLGVVTKAILKLLPLPAKTVSLLVPFDDMDGALNSVPGLMKLNCIPTAVEFMERDIILAAEKYLGKHFPDNSANYYLLLTYDGVSKTEIESYYPAVADVCLGNGASDMLIVDTEERKDSVWPARSAFLEAVKADTDELDECDVVVPKNSVCEYIKYTYALSGEHGVRIRSFGHAGDGNLHIYVLRDGLPESEWKQKLSAVFDDLYIKACKLGGKVSGEHGIGSAKREYLKQTEPAAALELMRRIKAAFDPKNILNPGKIL